MQRPNTIYKMVKLEFRTASENVCVFIDFLTGTFLLLKIFVKNSKRQERV